MKKEITNQISKIEIPMPRTAVLRLKIIGTAPLIQNKMTDAIKGGMRDKYGAGKKRDKTEVINDVKPEMTPEQQADSFTHYIDKENTILGEPISAFMGAIVTVGKTFGSKGAKLLPDINGEWLKRVITIKPAGLVQINYKKRRLELDSPIQKKVPFPIYRYKYDDWSCELEVIFNEAVLSPKDVISLFVWAGQYIGIGSWRKENHGRFTVGVVT